MKVLFIAYRFAPESSTGSIRSNKFAKYLAQSGVDVTVLTVANPPAGSIDAQTLADVGEQVKIHRSRRLEPQQIEQFCAPLLRGKLAGLRWRLRRFLDYIWYPDVSAFWVLTAFFRGWRLCRKQQFDVIYSSYAPAGAHLVALGLKKITKTPWIADYRDLWAHEWEYQPRSALHGKLDKYIERKFVKAADRSLFVSAQCMNSMTQAYPEYAAKFAIVFNGYDESDRPTNSIESQHTITFVHLGTLYSSRTIQHFIDALDHIIQQRPELKSVLVIEQVGVDNLNNLDARQVKLVNMGWQSRQVALQRLANASVCLLPFHSAEGGSDSLPLKMYEYLAFGHQILAAGKPGCQAEQILTQFPGCHFIADNDQQLLIDTMQACIEQCLQNPRPEYQRSGAGLSRFSRQSLAADLLGHMRSVSGKE